MQDIVGPWRSLSVSTLSLTMSFVAPPPAPKTPTTSRGCPVPQPAAVFSACMASVRTCVRERRGPSQLQDVGPSVWLNAERRSSCWPTLSFLRRSCARGEGGSRGRRERETASPTAERRGGGLEKGIAKQREKSRPKKGGSRERLCAGISGIPCAAAWPQPLFDCHFPALVRCVSVGSVAIHDNDVGIMSVSRLFLTSCTGCARVGGNEGRVDLGKLSFSCDEDATEVRSRI